MGRFNDNPAMQTHPHHLWWLRIATFSLAALAAASAAYWVLKWIAAAPAGVAAAPVYAAPAQTDPQVVARLLGGGLAGAASAPQGTVPASAASRFKLSGVVANRAQGGYALILGSFGPPSTVVPEPNGTAGPKCTENRSR